MRKPKEQFPFIISPYQSVQNTAAESGSVDKENSFAITEILTLLEKILSRNIETGEKLSRLYQKLGFLESAIDDLLDREPSDGESVNKKSAVPDGTDFFISIIPILDQLEAMKHIAEELGPKEWREGIVSFYEKLIRHFNYYDFKPAAETGMIFNPSYHESVGVEEQSKLDYAFIAEVVQSGWIYKERILRYAKVIVVRKESNK